MAALLLTASLAVVVAEKPTVGAIYFGDWHVNQQHAELHGPGWTEWELPLNAKPRYPGHLQPNVPLAAPGFGVNASEDDPTVFAAKIEAATTNGINLFLFDWYWYASPVTPYITTDLQGPGGGPFLDGALNKGFLKAPNREKMQFALMWANQDWVDVHPAKRGWHQTYRPTPGDPVAARKNRTSIHEPQAQGPVQELLVFDGFMTPSVYKYAFLYVAKQYFTEPNYYRAPTKLANGTTAMCCFFSIYQPAYVAFGNETLAAELMGDFRAAAEAVGQCLHLNHMNGGASKESTVARKVSSMTAYGWVKFGQGPKYTFPHTPYEIVAEHAWEQNLMNE
jgi:hypothetical protein